MAGLAEAEAAAVEHAEVVVPRVEEPAGAEAPAGEPGAGTAMTGPTETLVVMAVHARRNRDSHQTTKRRIATPGHSSIASQAMEVAAPDGGRADGADTDAEVQEAVVAGDAAAAVWSQ